jgi:hypothetical protein
MNFKSLNYFIIVLTVIGLLSLFLYTFFYNPKEISLLEDNTKYLDKVISVSGTIKNYNLRENNLFFEVCNYSKCMPVVYFNVSKNNSQTIKDIYLLKKEIKVTGKYILYNQKQEVILYKYEVK